MLTDIFLLFVVLMKGWGLAWPSWGQCAKFFPSIFSGSPDVNAGIDDALMCLSDIHSHPVNKPQSLQHAQSCTANPSKPNLGGICAVMCFHVLSKIALSTLLRQHLSIANSHDWLI